MNKEIISFINKETVVSHNNFTHNERRVSLRETKSWDESRLSDLNNGWTDWVDNKLDQ